MSEYFSLVNKTRGTMPRVAFEDIKDAVLGKRYELSVALLPPAAMRTAAAAAHHKTHGPEASNVLSFPLSKTSGEILLCPATARIQAPRFGRSAHQHLVLLFIHGLCHLKGLDHGSIMEHEENRIAERFGF